MWGGCALAWVAIFSFARFYHIYYLIMLGPAVAALAGVGAVRLWRLYRDPHGGWSRWLLPATLMVSLWAQVGVVASAPTLRGWLMPVLVGGTLVSVAVLLVEYVFDVRHVQLTGAALTVGMASLLLAPLAWSVVSVQNGSGGGWLVQAGPNTGGGFGGANGVRLAGGAPGGFGGAGGSGALTFAGPNWNRLDPGLVSYLQANQGSATYLVATTSSSYASLFILDSAQPAMALGGYQGWDRILTPPELSQIVANGDVRFFYLPVQRDGGVRPVRMPVWTPHATW